MIRTVIADDDEDLRSLVSLTLQLDGRFDVVGAASDGDEALALIEQFDPDLLILDLAMPNRDGLEVLVDLAGRERPPVVVMSGFSNPDLVTKAMSLGAAAYIIKGTGIERVADRIVAAVEGRLKDRDRPA